MITFQTLLNSSIINNGFSTKPETIKHLLNQKTFPLLKQRNLNNN